MRCLEILRRASLVILVALSSCTEPTPLYCNNVDRFCTDPAFPYCDTVAKKCIAAPDGFMPMDGATDGSVDMDMAHGDLAMCMSSSACANSTPICATGTCRACSGAADDNECKVHNSATPRCGSVG